MSAGNRTANSLLDTAKKYEVMAVQYTPRLEAVAHLLLSRMRAGGTVWVIGNGGSAALASHFAAELVGRFRRQRLPWPCVALTVDGAVFTALANDFAFEDVFVRQIQGLVKSSDVVLGLSTLGSLNVVRGMFAAQKKSAATVLISGQRQRPEFADCHIELPAFDTAQVQELTLAALHAITDIMEQSITVKETE